jgi:hypothetical protein
VPQHYPVLEGVRDFSVRQMDPNGNWLPQWPSNVPPGTLPTALEVSITLAGGEKIVRVFALQ